MISTRTATTIPSVSSKVRESPPSEPPEVSANVKHHDSFLLDLLLNFVYFRGVTDSLSVLSEQTTYVVYKVT